MTSPIACSLNNSLSLNKLMNLFKVSINEKLSFINLSNLAKTTIFEMEKNFKFYS